ncbi:MAG: hypothetical protein IJ087_13455 [Eggerthellaceae bacterium]|nr:hypothetical protein [Eggerthellaceae bacterium]
MENQGKRDSSRCSTGRPCSQTGRPARGARLLGGRGAREPGRGNPLFVVVVEMAKFRRMYNELTEEVLSDELRARLYLLVRGYECERVVGEMSERFDAMASFAREYGYALDDPELERDFDRWLDSVMEWNSGMRRAEKKGMAQGREEAAREIAAKLRELGIDEGVIAQATAGGTD